MRGVGEASEVSGSSEASLLLASESPWDCLRVMWWSNRSSRCGSEWSLSPARTLERQHHCLGDLSTGLSAPAGSVIPRPSAREISIIMGEVHCHSSLPDEEPLCPTSRSSPALAAQVQVSLWSDWGSGGWPVRAQDDTEGIAVRALERPWSANRLPLCCWAHRSRMLAVRCCAHELPSPLGWFAACEGPLAFSGWGSKHCICRGQERKCRRRPFDRIWLC